MERSAFADENAREAERRAERSNAAENGLLGEVELDSIEPIEAKETSE